MLNPALYQELKRCFKDVRVDDENVPPWLPPESNAAQVLARRVEHLGERFAVGCPYCGTVHPTLYIGHSWHVYKEVSDPLGRVVCLRGCLDDPARREDLRLAVWDMRGRRDASELPPTFVPLGQLPAGHHARQYLEGRGFDVDDLSMRWGVGYCDVSISAAPKLFDRIVIPVYGSPGFADPTPRLVGWTARALEDFIDAKYFNAAGMKKSEVLYRRPGAGRTPYVVVVEGPTDVWRLGDCAVAILGKKLSDDQRFLVRSLAVGRPIVLMYDPDAAKDMPKARLKLLRERRGDGGDTRVVIANLPAGKDPGKCTLAELEEVLAVALDGSPCYA